MQDAVIFVFWFGLLTILYTYIGYGIVLFVITKIIGEKNRTHTFPSQWPDVTIVIAAYNEVSIIEQKIVNTLALSYPGKRHVFIVTDGSDDGTPDVVSRYPEVRLFHESRRAGKAYAVNRVMKEVDSPIVIFSDANTFINEDALTTMVRHFADPHVGGVAGEKRIFINEADSASGSGEGIYWKYESFLKRKDSQLHSVQGAAGEFFSLRTILYEPPPPETIIEDFHISMRTIVRGYRFVYEPDAYAIETGSASVGEEWKRKVRISAGGLQSVAKLAYLLNPFRFGIVSFQYFSHRVLRWTLAPLSLLVVLVSNLLLVVLYSNSNYQILLWLQLAFYGLAFIGFLFRDRKIRIKGFFVPFYFVMMNLAVYAGALRFFRGKQSVIWKKAKRA